MTREQRIVGVGAVSGVVLMVAGSWLLSHLLPAPEGIESAGDRLAYALKWDAIAALPLFLMIGSIGNARFLSEAIDPLRGAEDRKMTINARVAQNTLEQLLLFVVATLALAAHLQPRMMPVLAAAAIVFTVARLAFWIGYRIDPLYRAPGFAATAYLNAGLLAWAVWMTLAEL